MAKLIVYRCLSILGMIVLFIASDGLMELSMILWSRSDCQFGILFITGNTICRADNLMHLILYGRFYGGDERPMDLYFK